MGNKSKRPQKRPRQPGAMSDLVVDTVTSAPAMLAAMVHDKGGAVSISYDVLAKVADELLLNVTQTPEGVRLWTTLKPIVRPQLEVPEGPAGIADLGVDVRPESESWAETEAEAQAPPPDPED